MNGRLNKVIHCLVLIPLIRSIVLTDEIEMLIKMAAFMDVLIPLIRSIVLTYS